MLRFGPLIGIIVVVGLLAVTPKIKAGGDGAKSFEAFRDTLLNLQIDSSSYRQVGGVVFEDGLITISLDSGSLVFLERYEGRRMIALFRGSGTAMFTPNHPTEVVNLQRFYHADQFSEEFDRGIFVFSDNRLTSLLDEFPAGGTVAKEFGAMVAEATEFISENDRLDIDGALSRCLLNEYTAPIFHAKLHYQKVMECILSHNPYDTEPFYLIARHDKKGPSELTFINQCPDVHGWPTLTDDGVEPTDQVRTSLHTMTCTIARSLDMITHDRVDMVVRADSVLWLEMELTSLLDVDSVYLGSTKLTMFRAKGSSRFWMKLPRWYHKGEALSPSISYSGDIIERVRDYTILRTSLDWIPAHSYFQRALYDVTFSYPSSMSLISLGKQESVTTVDRTTTSRWVTSVANTNNSFHIGLFKKRELEMTNETPTATMYYNTSDQADAVAMDVQQSMLFYTRIFGPLAIKHLNATELPGTHGEAFPGLLHLSTYAFVRAEDVSTDDFFGEQFTSHEVAHQWWGISVKPMIYRDRWLSEGFAEYSCLMYSQLAAQEQKKFFRLLEDYRKQIMTFGKKTTGADLAPPSVALGHRVRSGAGMAGGQAYNAFVYYKGAWVLHMLRNMMIDFKTMKEDVFLTVMKEFFTRYNGKRASTADFQHVIEEVTGTGMGWFFKEWVYGNELPTYRVAWKKEKLPEGQWKVTMRVKQENVSEDFTMLIPIKVTSDDKKFIRLRLNVTGKESEIILPHFSFEPDDVIFNDLTSVLCDVKTEKF
ncbi:MAG: M1 family aminopeptidase [Candidatus Kapabacteria bacterium]|nr:M1 family aminopeptidase [Candidatus Kapabacteria bacterium]